MRLRVHQLQESLDELAWVYTILGVVMMVCVLVVLALVLAYLFMLQHDQDAKIPEP